MLDLLRAALVDDGVFGILVLEVRVLRSRCSDTRSVDGQRIWKADAGRGSRLNTCGEGARRGQTGGQGLLLASDAQAI